MFYILYGFVPCYTLENPPTLQSHPCGCGTKQNAVEMIGIEDDCFETGLGVGHGPYASAV